MKKDKRNKSEKKKQPKKVERVNEKHRAVVLDANREMFGGDATYFEIIGIDDIGDRWSILT